MRHRTKFLIPILAVVLLAGSAWLILARHTQHSTLNAPQAVTVYITDTGECYHRASCSSLQYSKHPISLKDAREQYRPCSRCRPPE
ncbi:MAG TPA: hypothetical protein VMX94_11955 [Armatimonadota bacterium]|nr:hypothetical protein [Armatimonadota bacterium]